MDYSNKINLCHDGRENFLVKTMSEYENIYKQSIDNPIDFWFDIAIKFFWYQKPSKEKCLNYNFDIDKGKIFIEWFKDGITNMCYNCLDVHIENGLGDKIAFIWEGNEPGKSEMITYKNLYLKVNSFAKLLLDNGVKQGSHVIIYLPMIPELAIAMLACARIGAVHGVVFAGFSSVSLCERILDFEATHVICSDAFMRGKKVIEAKSIVDVALDLCIEQGYSKVMKCFIHNYLKSDFHLRNDRDLIINDLVESSLGQIVPCVPMEAEAELFVLYTSGSTGKPKGIVHTTGGYMIYSATTMKYVFNFNPTNDVMFCSADIGWITGHSYVVYGALLNGGTSIIFEGIPTYPTPSRYWEIIEKYKVTKFYTSPTALRSLIQLGNDHVSKQDLSSLRILGSVGEPIDQASWKWFYEVVGNKKCSIVDTYWQTETGGHMLTPLPGCTPMKPGCASFPFFGVDATLKTDSIWSEMHNCSQDDSKDEIEMMKSGKMLEGCLVFRKPWPGMFRTIYNDHARFESSYFGRFKGCYMTGDSARIDHDGYIWIVGRVDDMLNISGHLLSTLEVENTLIKHDCVSEAAVVSRPHQIKGECLHCFVVASGEDLDTVKDQLVQKIRQEIGAFAQPSYLQFVSGLPKTRSGKVMRRVLRKIADGTNNFGDTSTMINPEVLESIIENRDFCQV